MNKNQYKIVDMFPVRSKTVLVLNRRFETITSVRVKIDGKEMSFCLNSIPNWIIVDKIDNVSNRLIEFIVD